MSSPAAVVGVWKDYSYHSSSQWTLTLPSRWGTYATTGLTVLVSLAGTAMWTIVSYVLHQRRVRHNSESDTLDLQLQILLRNAGSPLTALADAWVIRSTWLGRAPRKMWSRLVPIIFAATLLWVTATVLALFVAEISGKDGDALVRRQPEWCGRWRYDIEGALSSETRPSFDDRQQFLIAARSYARSFYGTGGKDQGMVSISRFPAPRLSYTTKKVPCPFGGPGRCISASPESNNTALELDTGIIDSLLDLGINMPPQDRVNLRKVTTCSPMNTSDLIVFLDEVGSDGSKRLWANLTGLLGEAGNFTVLLDKQEGSLTYDSWCYNLHDEGHWASKGLGSVFQQAYTNSLLSVCFLMSGGVTYFEPVYDPFFLATRVQNRTTRPDASDDFVPYGGTNILNVLSCIDQYQVCNPNNNECTDLTYPSGAYGPNLTRLDLTPGQQIVADHSAWLLALHHPTAVFGSSVLGPLGMLASELVSGGFSLPVPENQWEREVTHWFESSLASVQISLPGFISRFNESTDIELPWFWSWDPVESVPAGEERDAIENYCFSHTMRSPDYQNFNFVAVLITAVFSTSIIITSLVIEPLVSFIRRRKRRTSERALVRQTARDIDGKYWLLGVALTAASDGLMTTAGQRTNTSIFVPPEKSLFHLPTANDDFYMTKSTSKEDSP